MGPLPRMLDLDLEDIGSFKIFHTMPDRVCSQANSRDEAASHTISECSHCRQYIKLYSAVACSAHLQMLKQLDVP